MSITPPRHGRIALLQGKIVASIAAALIFFTSMFGLAQKSHESSVVDSREAAEAQVEFWNVVAGKTSPEGSSSVNKLAVDLRESLGPIDPAAQELPASITEDFVAGPSEYPGVEQALGVDLFNNGDQGCSCGPLSDFAKNELLSVKRGDVTNITQQIQESMPVSNGIQLAPFGLSFPVWVGLVYLVGGTLAAVVAVRRDSKKHGYHQVEIDWSTRQGSADATYKRASKAMSPAYVYVVVPLQRKYGKNLERVITEIGLGNEYESVENMLKAIEKLPNGHPKKAELQRDFEHLQSMITDQVHNYLGRDRDFEQMEAEALSTTIAEEMERIGSTLKIREEARREVEAGMNADVLGTIEEMGRKVEVSRSTTRDVDHTTETRRSMPG